MDEGMVMIAVAPFYALGVVAVSYATITMCHMARRMDQSAIETMITETVTPPK